MSQTLSISKHTEKAFNAFFSSLAEAELAAAEQCAWIASDYEREGNLEMAQLYRVFEQEELGHHAMVKSLCREWVEPSVRAKQIYRGEAASHQPTRLERMAIVHLAFEPSALAFLGTIYRYADEFLGSGDWADQARETLGTIVREETSHVMHGLNLVKEQAQLLPATERKAIIQRMRVHQQFLSRGLRTFFAGSDISDAWIEEMQTRYRTRFNEALDAVG